MKYAPEQAPAHAKDSPDPAAGGALTAGQVKALKFAVIGMGVMILVGLAAVIGRMIYLASGGQKQAGVVTSVSNPRIPAIAQMALPAQASVRSITLSGNRLAVHYEGPNGSGIAVLDVSTGAVVSRIDLVPEPPR